MDKSTRLFPVRESRDGVHAIKETYSVLIDGSSTNTKIVHATFGIGVDLKITVPCVFKTNYLLPLSQYLKETNQDSKLSMEHYFKGRRSIYSRVSTVFLIGELRGKLKDGEWLESTSLNFFSPTGMVNDNLSTIQIYEKNFVGRVSLPQIPHLKQSILEETSKTIDNHINFVLSRIHV